MSHLPPESLSASEQDAGEMRRRGWTARVSLDAYRSASRCAGPGGFHRSLSQMPVLSLHRDLGVAAPNVGRNREHVTD
jgi:hypothetical protein